MGDPLNDSLGCASCNLSSGSNDRDDMRFAVRARSDGRGSGSELAQLSERLESVQSKRSRAQNSGLENEVAALDQDGARLRQMVVTLSGR